ncbi:MAG TPA: GH116 family glycosyl-hydrolase [Armatimonadota bacterium]
MSLSSSERELPYSREELYRLGPQRSFTGRQLAEIAFPLGGIGTGTVSLGGRGELRDWEIFNRPDKGAFLPFAFFTLRAQRAGDAPILRVLQAPPQPPFNAAYHARFDGSGFGVPRATGAGLPHMREATFTGEYPFARIDFSDPTLPLQVRLEAWNPTIPLNADDSGIPIAIFYWSFTNPSDEPVEITLVGNIPAQTPVGVGEILVRQDETLTALDIAFNSSTPTSPTYGSIALSTTWMDTTVESYWRKPEFDMGQFAPLEVWAERLLTTGRLRGKEKPSEDPRDVGSLGLVATVYAGETVTLPMFISWSFPNYEKSWGKCCGTGPSTRWRNYYAERFPDAWTAAHYTAEHLERLDAQTRLFHDVLFTSTLPAVVLDAVSSQISVLKSTTCLRLPDGTLYGFEGCHGNEGCCEGSCTHVWNYAQTHAFLYPDLERGMRETEYRYSMTDDGKVQFRLQLPPGSPLGEFTACADGQLGAIMQVYRDWQLGAGDDWLRAMWPYIKRSLEYVWNTWDIDHDGLMEFAQHTTYDVELRGPNILCGAIYLGALRAAAQMANYLGEVQFAVQCRTLEENGNVALDERLFFGQYYVQPHDPLLKLPHQIGPGCLIDQLFGQQLAHLYGLGYLLPVEHVRSAVSAVYQHNFRTSFWDHLNYERVFALNDEAGTLVCTWPHGGRPKYALPYADEVMVGFEYQLAAHLIYEGMIDEGLTVTKAVRDRHDGERRNPWNEFECGNHYVRSMANWGIKLALDGFTFSAVEERLGFAPKVNAGNYRTFWSTATAWGRFAQQGTAGLYQLDVLYGTQTLQRLDLAEMVAGSVTVTGPEGPIATRREGNTIRFSQSLTLPAGSILTVRVMD